MGLRPSTVAAETGPLGCLQEVRLAVRGLALGRGPASPSSLPSWGPAGVLTQAYWPPHQTRPAGPAQGAALRPGVCVGLFQTRWFIKRVRAGKRSSPVGGVTGAGRDLRDPVVHSSPT